MGKECADLVFGCYGHISQVLCIDEVVLDAFSLFDSVDVGYSDICLIPSAHNPIQPAH